MVNKTNPATAPVPPEEEVPPLTSSCWDIGGGGGEVAAEGDPIDNGEHCDAAAVLNLMCDDIDDNVSSWSLQRQVDDLFDRYWLSPNTVKDEVLPVSADFAPLLQCNKSDAGGSITAALSFPELHSIDATRSVHLEESKDDGSILSNACESSVPEAFQPTFRVVLLTSTSTVTVELVADAASWSSSQGDFDSEDDQDEEFKAVKSKASTTLSSNQKETFSRRAWLVPTDDDSDQNSSKDIRGIEVIPRKHGSNDGSYDQSTTCSESSDDASFSRSLASPLSVGLVHEAKECIGPDSDCIDAMEDAERYCGQPIAPIDEHRIDAAKESINDDQKHAVREYDGGGVPMPTATRKSSNDDPNDVARGAGQEAGKSSTNTNTPTVAEDRTEDPEAESGNVASATTESEREDAASVERGQTILDAAEETAEERLEDAIVLSFTSSGDVVLPETQNINTSSLALLKDPPAKTTARRVRSLLNGMFELNDSDGSAAAGVKNVVQRIEEKMVVRRRTVTGNRHFKVSRPKISDDASEESHHSSTSHKVIDPVHLSCKFILRLASSDSESDDSTSEDSSTTVTGSYVLSAGATDTTQGAESKQLEDVKSFVMMFRQLKAVETRQQRWERRFQSIHTGPVEKEENGSNENGQRVAEKCNRIAERLKEISGRQVVVPDDRERKRLEAEYRRLEKQLEEYGAEHMLSQIHCDEQRTREAKWEEDNRELNRQALASVRRYMPVHVRTMAVSSLIRTLSPNGKVLPENVARKFKVSTTILQLLRIDPMDIERMHPSVLEDLRMVDLTLLERRALHCHLRGVGESWEKRKAGMFNERRWAWFEMLKSNFKEELALHSHNERIAEIHGWSEALSATDHRSCSMLNPESDIDYSDDYGFPEGDEYELLTASMRRGELSDFASTLDELRKTDSDADGVDFFGPIIERMKGLDEETVQFQNEIATLEDTIRSLGICHTSQMLEPGQEISSTESSSTDSINS